MSDFPSQPHRVRAFNSANISCTSSAATILSLNSETFDSHGLHDTVTNNSRLTAKKSGTYVICGAVEWAGASPGVRQIRIKLNGTTYLVGLLLVASTADSFKQTITTIYDMVAGDYVELEAFQDQGGALNVVASAVSPVLSMVSIG